MPNSALDTFWHRQSAEKPLFPNILWSRPERRTQSGKLLIIGGNSYGFAAPAEAYAMCEKAGIGEARVMLPDALKKTVGKSFVAGQFVPSNPSGSFSQKALADILDTSVWADGVLIPGDLGRNSETTVLFEAFIDKYKGPLTITNDAIEYVIQTPTYVTNRDNTLLVISLPQLQKLAISLAYTEAFTSTMNLIPFVETLHNFTTTFAINIIVEHIGQLFVAVGGQISSTKTNSDTSDWQTKTAAYGCVWWAQHKENAFAALSSAAYALET